MYSVKSVIILSHLGREDECVLRDTQEVTQLCLLLSHQAKYFIYIYIQNFIDTEISPGYMCQNKKQKTKQKQNCIRQEKKRIRQSYIYINTVC